MAVNRVTVVSNLAVAKNATAVVIGIKVVNDVELTGFVLPLEYRDTDANGTFMVGPSSTFKGIQFTAGNRMGSSPLTGSVTQNKYGTPNATNDCSGPVASTWPAPNTVDFNGLEAALMAAVSQAAPPKLYYLPPGDDDVAGTFTDWPDEGETTPYAAGPSLYTQFNVNAVEGCFEIDTCCILPANHISGTDLQTNIVPFEFVLGEVCIPANQCPTGLAAGPQNPNPALTGALVSVQLSATDPEGDPLTYYPSRGSVNPATGEWTDTPGCPDVPSYPVTVEIGDNQHAQGACASVQFTVAVAPANLSITCPGNMTVHWGDVASGKATASGGCPPYTYTASIGSIDNDGNWSYTTTCQDLGTTTVTITVNPSCTFDLTVTNAAPVCANIPDYLALYEIPFSIDLTTTQGDGDPIQYLNYTGPAWASIVGTNVVGTRPTGDPAEYIVGYDMFDGCQYTHCSFKLYFEKSCAQVDACIAIEGETGVAYDSTLNGRNHTMYVVAHNGSVPDLAGGFNFLICYDQSGLSFLGAGQTSELGWEYFTYRTGMFGGNCGSGCPNGFVRLVGVADMNDAETPVAGSWNLNGKKLAWLKFYVTADRNYINSCFHVKFCSIECGDNSISDSTGNILWLPCPGQNSNDIAFGPDYSFAACLGDTAKYEPKELLKFCGGAICVREPNDDRGDINLNGIANEIGDAVLYTNYFIYGDIVFDPNPNYKESQILASDVNNDGIVLTVADLIYLIRIITGDAEPFPQGGSGHPKLSPYANAVNVVSDVSDGALNVSTSSNVEVGGAVLVYRYSGVAVGTPVAAPGFEIKSRASNGELRMVVYGAKVPAGSNTLVSVPVNGNGTIELVESQFSDYNGALLTVNAAKVGPPKEYALLQNYPNPFNAGTVIPVALKDASEWSLSIYNVAGQVVRTFSGSSDAGIVNVAWDGRTADGSSVATGVYFYRVTTPNFTATKKMVLLK
ncbi:MAG: T9SS type A sorting domain-containing protein [Candidatus Zixiibacteriota bacterium]